MKYLSNHVLSQPITYAEVRELRLSELNAARQYDDIGLDVLLTQAGYYTIREVTEDGYALLGYPNWEVAGSMAELYANELTQGKRIRSSAATPIRSAMEKGGNIHLIVPRPFALQAQRLANVQGKALQFGGIFIGHSMQKAH